MNSVYISIPDELLADNGGGFADAVSALLRGERQPASTPAEPDTPAGHLALLDATDGALRAVVELHALMWTGSRWHPWRCEGCDAGSYAEDNPDWPCTTVLVVADKLGVDLGGGAP